MKFGVKTYDSKEFLDSFLDDADFFEVQAIRKNDYFFLKDYLGKKDIVIHCEHQGFGVNLCDSSRREVNLNAISFAQKLADLVFAKKIIVHLGYLEEGNENCFRENAIELLKDIDDKRICIENVPYVANGFNGISFGSSPKEIKEVCEKTGCGFCFDINHAIDYAMYLKEDIYFVLKEFELLSPRHYHIGGQKIQEGISHLDFKDSDLDLKKIFSLLDKDAEITLEVGIGKEEVREDLRVVREI
jgi:endonuclease IV